MSKVKMSLAMNIILGFVIRYLREEMGITQWEASGKSGYSSTSSWSHLESGRTSLKIDTLEGVAMCLGYEGWEMLKIASDVRAKMVDTGVLDVYGLRYESVSRIIQEVTGDL